jgi:hypothetical protein
MYFRTTYLAQDLGIRIVVGGTPQNYENSEMVLRHNGPHEVVVRLRNATEEEISLGYEQLTLFCDASSYQEPNDAVHAMFRSLSQGQLPEDSVIPEWDEWKKDTYIAEGGALKAAPPLRWLPRRFQSFFSTVNGQLLQAVGQTVSMLRWRGAIKGPHDPLSNKGTEWSLDGENWYAYNAVQLSVELEDSGTVHVTDTLHADVETLIAEGTTEPIGHELFREAWTLRHRNARSALVIGVAALEAGFKEFVADLVPEASWLVENLPTPPVHMMLREYLPHLPARLEIDDQVLPPPEEILQTLKKAVSLRNKVAHVGQGVTPDKVQEILPAIEDVLWLLDFYRGFGWAYNHITVETKQRLEKA